MAAVNLYTHQSENVSRTWILMAVFLCVVVALGFVASWYFNNLLILFIAFFLALATNIWGYWNSDKVALRLSRAVPADEHTYAELHNIVENLSITAGLPKPRVYIINDEAPNAFATGRDKNHAAIAVTTGLLSMMDRTELEGVIGHELSHIGNRDILISTIAVVLVGLVSILADFFLRASFWSGGSSRNDGEKGNPLLAIIAIAFIVLSPILATMLQLAISRRREFLADTDGALLTRYPEGLASALRKLGNYQRPMQHANSATAHMFIANPFGAKELHKGIARLFSTHPPMEERIEALIGEK